MNIQTTVIDQYLSDEPIQFDYHLVYPENSTLMQVYIARKEVVKELQTQLLKKLGGNNLYNSELCKKIFTNFDTVASSIHLHLLVGAPKSHDIYTQRKGDETHVYIDLIQIADETNVIKEMLYLIMHELTKITVRKCIQKEFNDTMQFHDKLNYMTFYQGLCEYLSWNENYQKYKLDHTRYSDKRMDSMFLLHHAFQEEAIPLQNTLLQHVENASLWQQFTTVTGLFYFFDLMKNEGEEAFIECCQKGDKDFLQEVFKKQTNIFSL